MKDRVAEFYRKKEEKCKIKLRALKKSRKGIIRNDISESLLEDVEAQDLEKRIAEVAQEIIYYREKLHARQRQHSKRLLEWDDSNPTSE